MVLLGEDLLDFHHVEHCLADVGVSAPLNLFSVEKKNPGYRDSKSRPNASEGYEPNELPGKNKGKENNNRKEKKKKRKNTRRLLTQRLCSCATLNYNLLPQNMHCVVPKVL